LAREPRAALLVLAARAVPVAAGAVNEMLLAAGFALVNGGAVRFRTAVHDGVDHFFVGDRHRLAEALEVLPTVGSKELVEETHGQRPSITWSINA
jgi:hypothetical protein